MNSKEINQIIDKCQNYLDAITTSYNNDDNIIKLAQNLEDLFGSVCPEHGFQKQKLIGFDVIKKQFELIQEKIECIRKNSKDEIVLKNELKTIRHWTHGFISYSLLNKWISQQYVASMKQALHGSAVEFINMTSINKLYSESPSDIKKAIRHIFIGASILAKKNDIDELKKLRNERNEYKLNIKKYKDVLYHKTKTKHLFIIFSPDQSISEKFIVTYFRRKKYDPCYFIADGIINKKIVTDISEKMEQSEDSIFINIASIKGFKYIQDFIRLGMKHSFVISGFIIESYRNKLNNIGSKKFDQFSNQLRCKELSGYNYLTLQENLIL